MKPSKPIAAQEARHSAADEAAATAAHAQRRVRQEPGDQRDEDQLDRDQRAEREAARQAWSRHRQVAARPSMRKHCTRAVRERRTDRRRQQRGAVDAPVAHADERERECRGGDAEPDPEPLGDGCGQVGERHADQQRGRRIRREHAARELVRLMAGRDRVAHALEIRGVVGRDAVQDVPRRDHEVAVEVERPRARAGVEARDERRPDDRDRQRAQQEPLPDSARANCQPVRAHGRAPEYRAHTNCIDPNGPCGHPPGEGGRARRPRAAAAASRR